MDYGGLLEEAYREVKPVKQCERFEVLNVRGHHEGTRTFITNFLQISSCIRRSAQHLMKFLSKELASSSEVSGDRLILSRRLSSRVVDEKIGKYVRRFVLCEKCKKPDTELVKERGGTFLRCLACGARYRVQDV